MFGLKADFELTNINKNNNTVGPTVFTFGSKWNFGPFAASSMTGTISGSSSSFDVAIDANGKIFGQTLDLSGEIHSNGKFDFKGTANVGLAPLASVTASFELGNLNGPTSFTFKGAWSFGPFASSGNITATITSSSSGFSVYVDAKGTLLGNTIELRGYVYQNSFNLHAYDNVKFFGVSLTEVTIDLSSTSGFGLHASWSYPLFSGRLDGSIGLNGRIQIGGNGTIGLANFGLNVKANVDLNPAAGTFYVDLSSHLNVFVATVDFDAQARWTTGSLPTLVFTGHADIGGILSKILQGSASFTIGTDVVGFKGSLSIPEIGVSLSVDASVDGFGDLSGIPGLDHILGILDISKYAAKIWHGLQADWSQVADGLNHALGIADQEVSNLLKKAHASPEEVGNALKDAFHWTGNQLSNFLGGGGGLVSSAVDTVTNIVSGHISVPWGVPQGSLVFFDANRNGILESDEAWGYTTSQGNITFQVPATFDTNSNGVLDDEEGQWVVQGGIDLTTGLAPAFSTVGPASWTIASPLTTLVSALEVNNGLTGSQAEAKVLAALNLPAGLDLSTYDPNSATLAGDLSGRIVENVHAQVEDTVALIGALFRSPYNEPASTILSGKIINAIAGLIAQSAGPVDLSNPTTMTALIQAVESSTGVSLDTSLVNGAASVIASCNQQFSSISATGLNFLAAVSQVKRVVQSTVVNALANAAAGQTSIDTVIANDTGAPLAAAISAAVTPPYLQVPLNIVAPATSPQGAAVDFTVQAFDLAGQSLSVTSTFPSGTIFPIGTTMVTAQATDSLGNTTSNTFTVTVADSTAPTINLPANVTVEADTAGGANVTLPQATAADSVDGNPTVSEDQTSGFFGLGVTPITVTATDSAGNKTISIFTVTVVDQTAPSLNLPDNLTVEANLAGGADVDLPQVTAADAADPSPLLTLDQTSGFFPIGITVVHVTVTDASGNSASGSFTVTVVDTAAPALSLPADLVFEANAAGGANITLPDVFVSDDGDPNPTLTINPPSGFFPIGTTTVNIAATDVYGNLVTGSYTVTVQDTTPAEITLPDNLVIQANVIGGADVTLPDVVVTDASDPNPIVTIDQQSGFFPLGTTIVNVSTIDAFGNVSSGSYTVTVVNNVAPSFVLAPGSQVQTNLIQTDEPIMTPFADSNPLAGYDMVVESNTRGGAIVTLPNLSATSPSDAAPLITFDHKSGFFPVGTTVINVTASDESGNMTTGSFNVTVVDTAPPQITVPVDVSFEADVADGGAQVTLPSVVVTDLGDPNPTVTLSKQSGFFPMGPTTVTVTATDASGNTSTSSFVVTVVDTTPPSVTPPPNIVVPATSANGAQVTLPQSTVTDLVDGHPAITYDHPSGLFPVGTTLVTVRATDAAGNTGTATFAVTVDQVPTTTTLQAHSANISTYGDTLSFTVDVTAGLGVIIPDGEVVDLVDAANNNAVVGTGIIENGTADITIIKLNAGQHSLVAVYPGYLNNGASQSAALNQLVNPRALQIKAVTSTKNYDGTTATSTKPVVVGLQAGDTISGLSESFTDSSIGFDKTLVPSGLINDGNNGNNYSATFVNNVTGTITISLDALNSVQISQPTFSGVGGTANGDSNSVTVNVYTGPLAAGQPLQTLLATMAGGHYSVQTTSSLGSEGIYTAQAVQDSGTGRPYLSVPMTFTIDTTPPTLAAPPHQTLIAVQNSGVTDNAAFTAIATDNLTQNPTVTYRIGEVTITSNYVFPVGQTTVTVTAADVAGNQVSNTFAVTVTSAVAPQVKFNVGDTVTLSGTPPHAGDAVQWQESSDGVHFDDIVDANQSSYVSTAAMAHSGHFFRALFTSASETNSSTPAMLVVNQFPIAVDGQFNIAENSAAGTAIGTVSASDPDINDSLTYSITGGNSAGAFTVNSATGQISIANAGLIDFETHPTWILTVQVQDNSGATDTATVTIHVTNVNEAPLVSNQTLSVVENSSNNTSVGTVQASDPDAGDTVTYSITNGNTQGAFAINSQTGVITVANSSILDFETHPTWPLTVNVTDNHGVSSSATVTINLTDVNENPQVNNQTLSIAENSSSNSVVGTVQATPFRQSDTLTFSITAGNTGGAFAINAQTGVIAVASFSLLDFETHPTWPLTVQVADNHGGSTVVTVTVNLTDVGEGPQLSNQTFTIAENSSNNIVVGMMQATPSNPADTLTYSIIGGNTDGAFTINPQTGWITVAQTSKVDFEAHPTFILTIQVADNHGAKVTSTETINLTDANDAPQLALNGSAINFSAKAVKKTKSGPLLVAPSLTVVDADQSPAFKIGGGTLTVSITVSAKVSKKGKVTMYDIIGGLSGASSLGTATSPTFDNGSIRLSVQLSANTTTDAIQNFLRGITFTTKGAGLKLTHRTLTAQVTDVGGAASNSLAQTVNVAK